MTNSGDQIAPILPPIEEVPAAHLTGRVLSNGWTIGHLVQRLHGATGGHFSLSYHVEHADGRRAFLKALNFAEALRGSGRVADQMQAFSGAYVYERDLLHHCRDRRMRRVISLLDDGEVEVPEAGVLGRVPYLIFEMAEGDIRAYMAQQGDFDLAWVLRALKHATEGIEQLHAAHTAHQDLKPSNVLTQAGGREMKLGDLGCAEHRARPGPRTDLSIPGAIGYAPPEQLYGGFDRGWESRRAGDLYHLGSLAAQFFLGQSMTSLLVQELPPQMHPRVWSQTFSGVLPALRNAHTAILADLEQVVRSQMKRDDMTNDFIGAVRQLTEPDPMERGHPRDRKSRTSGAPR